MKWIPMFACLAAGLFLAGCQKIEEFQEAEIESGDAEFAIPLVKASLSIEDLLENFDEYTYIEIAPDGIIHLRYKGDVLTQSAAEFFQAAKDSIPAIIPVFKPVDTLPFSSPDQLEIDYAVYKSGRVSIYAQSEQYQGLVNLTVSLPQATKNGVPMSVSTQFMSPTPSIGFFSTEFQDMAGYILVPTGGVLYANYIATNENGDTIPMKTVALVNLDVDFSYIEGYLGNFKHKGKRDTVYIEFFKNWRQGDVFFEKPEITITIDNSFGVPTRSVIDLFDILTADDLRIPLESTFITETGIDFAYPSLQNVGKVESMVFPFDANNSNIEVVLGSRPIGLDYKVDALMNPDTVSELRGFITDSSFYKIQVEVDLPLHGRASDFGVTDTFTVDFSGYNKVKEVEFKLVADNGTPLDINAQVFFLDENNVLLDSLFDGGSQRVVRSAPVNSNGEVTAFTNHVTFANFPGARFDEVRSAKKLALTATFSTTNEGQQSIKAYKEQAVAIRMGMRLKI